VRINSFGKLENKRRIDPSTTEDLYLEANANFTWKNFTTTGSYLEMSFLDVKDFYDPREEGRFNVTLPYYLLNFWISPDYRKTFLVDANVGMWRTFSGNQHGVFYSISPRWRINNQLLMIYRVNQNHQSRALGYSHSENDDIFFSIRKVNTVTHSVEANYIFTSRMVLGLVGRLYWSKFNQNEFFTLREDGGYTPTTIHDRPGETFAAFSNDLVYSWEFLPGSWFTAAWKWNNFHSEDPIFEYGRSLINVLDQEAINRFSIKLLYYLDYQDLKRKK